MRINSWGISYEVHDSDSRGPTELTIPSKLLYLVVLDCVTKEAFNTQPTGDTEYCCTKVKIRVGDPPWQNQSDAMRLKNLHASVA